jgi:UDP-glucose 4-epimerase
MKVLITGVAGLLGSRLADWILSTEKGVSVVGIDDLSGGYQDNVDIRVTLHKIKIQSDALADIFEEEKPDLVFHFAAYAAEGLSPFIRRFNYTNNLLATANVVSNCINHDVKRLVFSSSMATYGANVPPFDEKMIPAPIDPYGIAKVACERDIQVAGEMHGLDWCIIRPHNVYGQKQNIWDKYRNVLGIWMFQHLNGMPLSIFGDGQQRRAFSYIGDCVGCLWRAGISPFASKQIINLGGIKDCSIDEASDTLLEVMGAGSKVYYEKRHEVKYAWSTYQKSVDLLGYEDRTPLKDGLAAMWAWAKSRPMRPRKIWDQFEVEKGLYSFWQNT